ncbi:hypothetical protein [Micromonospora vulcania]|uniref:DUF4878 domain-containing protein n=1 Tax=Micromonospora vulcania TaxID=1441873 RepID=A0ABW1H839_9ACTN
MVAGYLAKYATESTEITGHRSVRASWTGGHLDLVTGSLRFMVLLAGRIRRRLLLALLLVVCLLVCWRAFAWQGELNQRRDRSEAKAALSKYLERVRGSDYGAAYEQLCSDVLSEYTASDHAAFLREQRRFVSFSIGEPTQSTGIDGTYLIFPVDLAYADQSTSVVRLAVGLETGGPKVCDHYEWRK